MSEQESTLDEFVSDSVDSSSQKSEKKLRKLVEKDAAGVWGDEPNGDGVKVLRATNYGENTIDLSDVAVRDIPESKRTSKKLEPGDIIVERSGGSADQPVGRVLFFNLEGEYYHGNFLRQLRPKASEINSRYLYYYLDYDYKRGGTKPLQTNTTNIRNLQYSSYLNQNIPVKPLLEQRKIATVLYTVDQAIEKTEKIIEQSERFRTGIMQDIFSRGSWNHDEFRETKYGSIPSDWEIKTVKEISNRIGSGGTPSTDKDEYYGGNIAWVKTDDLNSGLVAKTKTKITEKGLNESAAKLFPEGTVVFAMYGGSLGQNGRLGIEAAMNQACCGIVADESVINSDLLHQQLIHRKQQLTALSAGTHQQNISQSMIEKFEIFVPSLEEQKEMIEILKSVDNVIEKNHNEKSQLKRIKQGLMQDLLSGTVRTTDTNITVPDEVAQHG